MNSGVKDSLIKLGTDETINILHIDDDDGFLELTQAYLAHIGESNFKLDSISDPEQVSNKVKNAEYDIIVSDYKMPIIDGLELFNKLKEQGSAIPFILFTGHSREEIAIKALNLGVDYYITKGIDVKSQYKELSHIIKTIAKHKNAERKLRRSEELLRTVIDNIPQIIFWKNRDSVYLGCNKNFAQVSGVGTPDLIVGKTDFDLSWKNSESYTCREYDRNVMESDTPQYHVLEELRQPDGTDAFFDTNKIPLRDEKENIIGLLGTYENITKRKESEDALKKQKEELAEYVDSMKRDLCVSLKEMEGHIDIFKEEKNENYLNKVVKTINNLKKILK